MDDCVNAHNHNRGVVCIQREHSDTRWVGGAQISVQLMRDAVVT
jgi:hypothetical protein